MPVHMQSYVRRVTFDQARLDRLARSILSDVGEASAELGILFVGDQRMRSLNRQYRGKDRTTDVLAFAMREAPHSSAGLLGDVVIAVPTAVRQAKQGQRSLDEELTVLLVHGILHLCGYDHERGEKEARRMHRRERMILRSIGSLPKRVLRTRHDITQHGITSRSIMGWLQRLNDGLTKTRGVIRGSLDRLLGRAADPALLEEFEEALIASDLGARVVDRVMERLKKQLQGTDASQAGQVQKVLRDTLLDVLTPVQGLPLESLLAKGPKPFVILAVGVNGVGKTTTIAKIAQRLVQAGKRPLLVAGDTFRAAAIDQLQVWADRVGVDVIRHRHGADPAAVAFDGIAAAKARQVDVVLIDTAGRLHTKSNLMDELRKITRVIAQECPGAPHEVLLVLDATVGQNALSQARQFHQAVGVTGLVLTKLDGTARGGIVVAIAEELKLPVRLIGVGESVEDLQDFQSDAFVDALLGTSVLPSA